MNKSSTRFYWLDLLRFLAALTVVIAHTRGTVFVEYGALIGSEKTWIVTAAYAFTRVANEAVVLFFVLSGFLVGGRVLERIHAGSFRPTDYAIDRSVRILLPLIPALVLTAIVRLTIDGSIHVSHLLGNLVFLQGVFFPVFGGNAPLWSLSYEVWFYVLAWAIGMISIDKEFHLVASCLVILVAAIFTSLASVYLFCWLIGAFAYIRRPKSFSITALLTSVLFCIYGVVAIQLGSDSISVSVDVLKRFVPSLDVSRIILTVGLAMLIQQAINFVPKSGFAHRFDSMGTALAAFSYTLYLTHFPILQLMEFYGLHQANHITVTSIGIFLSTIIACLFVAWLLYLLFERQTDFLRTWVKNKC
jgi:peptidoglycan/LPS O-acetylase OafA/YrhL